MWPHSARNCPLSHPKNNAGSRLGSAVYLSIFAYRPHFPPTPFPISPWERGLYRAMRVGHYRERTWETYRQWAGRFVRFVGERGGRVEDAGTRECRAFLDWLAVEQRISAATQRQALNGLVALFKHGLGREAGDFSEYKRAKRKERVPVVLSAAECRRVFDKLEGTWRLMAELMYGSGLRLSELVTLRVKDVDLERGQLVLRSAKGDEDRPTVLPEKLRERLEAHLAGRGCGSCMRRTVRRRCRGCTCRKPLRGSIRRRGRTGSGSGFGR